MRFSRTCYFVLSLCDKKFRPIPIEVEVKAYPVNKKDKKNEAKNADILPSIVQHAFILDSSGKPKRTPTLIVDRIIEYHNSK